MYSRQVGLNRLYELRNGLVDLGEFDYEVNAKISLKFDLFGREGIEVEDLELFHASQSMANLKPVEMPTKYQLDIKCKAIPGQEDSSEMDLILPSITKGYSQARIMLAGIAASARCLILRRHLTFFHDGVDINIADRPDLKKVKFEQRVPEVNPEGKIHAGNLYGSIMVLTMFNTSWSEAFLHNYECGQMFLLAPMELNPSSFNSFSHFLSEAYLSFFRCLEYIVMVKVLKERGQFKGSHLRRAFERLDCKSADESKLEIDVLKIHANDFIRKRGQYAAHLLVGGRPEELNHQDVYQLKELVDFLFCAALASSKQIQQM